MPMNIKSNEKPSDIRCGVCHCSIEEKSTKGTDRQKPFYCSSCINFRLLKYNLNNIHLTNLNGGFQNEINSILSVCLNHCNEAFLHEYSHHDEHGTDQFSSTQVPVGSVARLAFMLLNVNMVQKQHYLNEIITILAAKREGLNSVADQIAVTRETRDRKSAILERQQDKLDLYKRETAAEVAEVKDLLSVGIVNRQNRLISREQQLLIRDLLVLWNIEILDSRQLVILFRPILPVDEFRAHSADVGFGSLVAVSQVTNSLAHILAVHLPFEIETSCNELRLGERRFQAPGNQRFSVLERPAVSDLCSGISRVILNMVVLLQRVDQEFPLEKLTCAQLVDYPVLLIHIIQKLGMGRGASGQRSILASTTKEGRVEGGRVGGKRPRWFSLEAFGRKEKENQPPRSADMPDLAARRNNVIPRYTSRELRALCLQESTHAERGQDRLEQEHLHSLSKPAIPNGSRDNTAYQLIRDNRTLVVFLQSVLS